MEPKTTHSIFTNIINYKRLFLFCFFSLFLVLTAGATEYIINSATNDESGVSIAGEKVIEGKDFTIYWQFLLWLAMMNSLSAKDIILYPVKFIFPILGFRITERESALDEEKEKQIISALQNEMTLKIILKILEKECNTNKDLVKTTGISKGAITWYMKQLK